MRGIRLDLFICMILAGLIFAGVFFIGDKLDLGEKLMGVVENVVEMVAPEMFEEGGSADDSSTIGGPMLIFAILMGALPLVLFALYMFLIFWIHSLFVKKGIFPPVFPNKKW